MTDADSPPALPPARATLRRGLEQVLAGEVAARGPFRITNRRRSPLTSTHLADVVRVRFADGTTEPLLCKYSSGVDLDPASPHRGLAHEAAVYDRVLRDAPVPLPHVWGGFRDADTGDLALVMRFYDDALPAVQAAPPGGAIAAVRWLAALHAWAESRLHSSGWDVLARYDAAYYRRWLDRTCHLAGSLAAPAPWLDRVAAAYRDWIPLLVAAPPTLVHGEFTPRNALWADGRVVPVDWETAAIGPGAIDLAVFTFDWDVDELPDLERAYAEARWGGAAPADFAATLRAARLYVSFHWIFSGSFHGDAPRIRAHLEGVLDEAIRLGLVPAGTLLR